MKYANVKSETLAQIVCSFSASFSGFYAQPILIFCSQAMHIFVYDVYKIFLNIPHYFLSPIKYFSLLLIILLALTCIKFLKFQSLLTKAVLTFL